MKQGLTLSFLLCLISSTYLLAQNPYIQHYTTVDGLPSNMVYQVYQDSHKFIWFATDAGVARFDGSRFTYFRKNDGLSSNEIVRIKEDSSERIWFFNLNASLDFFYQNTIFNGTNAPFLDSLRSIEFFCDFFEDEDKTIYFHNNNQREIFALDSQNNVAKYKLPSIPLKFGIFQQTQELMKIRDMSRAADGAFYLRTGAGLFKLNELSTDPVLVSDAFNFTAVFPGLGETSYAVIITKNDTYKIIKFKDEIQVDTLTPSIWSDTDLISSILEDVDGFLWVSTFDRGVYCYKDNKIIRHFDIKEAQAVIQDHENNIWISSMKDGVYKISPYLNQHIHYENSNFQNSGILAWNHHISNGIWCTNGKTVFLLQNDNLFTSDFQNEEGSLNQICHVNNNTLMVGEISSRQYALEGIQQHPSSKKMYFKKISISPKPLKKLALNISRNEISAFSFFSLTLIDPEKLFNDVKLVIFSERVFNIFYNSNDELIVNAKRNYRYENDSLVVCKELSCFDNKIITDHLILNNATELMNLEGDTLFLLNNKQLYNLTAVFGYSIDLQIKYMDYHEPTLFIATTRNIYVCENPLNILDNKPVQLQPVDISFRNIHDMLFSNDLLYIASDDGLTAIPYAAIHEINTHAPIPYFQSIQINDENVLANVQNVTLTGRNRIHIVFSSINYSFSPVIFAYKLEGADDDWTTGTGMNVVYQNLPRGDYIFNLKVRKPTSDWSEPVEFGITINATIWRHPLFFVVLAIVVGMSFSLVIIRRKNIQLKRREMDHQMIILEQKALQSMMNPHFIFNTLGSIQNFLLQNKPGEAGIYLSQFARLIRQNLGAINSSMVHLDAEVDRIKNYLDLEKLRMGNKFEYTIKMDENIEEEEILIPSMIIQPFVENSIWHGISPLEEKGFIRLSFFLYSQNALQITIEDNGVGMKQSGEFSSKNHTHLHLGMSMTRKRLEIIGKKYHVETSVETSEAFPGVANPGTLVVLMVPVAFGEVGG